MLSRGLQLRHQQLRRIGSAEGLVRDHFRISLETSGYSAVGALQSGAVLQTGSLIKIGQCSLEVPGDRFSLLAFGFVESLVDVEHFATHLLHRPVDQIPSECPVFDAHQAGQFRETALRLFKGRGLTCNNRCVVRFDGGRRDQTQAQGDAEAERGEAAQGLQYDPKKKFWDFNQTTGRGRICF